MRRFSCLRDDAPDTLARMHLHQLSSALRTVLEFLNRSTLYYFTLIMGPYLAQPNKEKARYKAESSKLKLKFGRCEMQGKKEIT
jgi:hypothetical protein